MEYEFGVEIFLDFLGFKRFFFLVIFNFGYINIVKVILIGRGRINKV